MAYLLLIIMFFGVITMITGGDLMANAKTTFRKLEAGFVMGVGVLGILTSIFYLVIH